MSRSRRHACGRNCIVCAYTPARNKRDAEAGHSYVTEWDVPELCDDCQRPLDGKAVDHGLEGFGHQGRCCACYDKRMRGDE